MTFLLIVLAVVVAVVASAVLLATNGPMPPAGLSDADIRSEARAGNKIVAIRWYRTLHGVGLKRAKEAVERLANEP